MIKIFTLLNLVGLFIFNFFFAGDVSVVQDIPNTLAPGSEVRVSVTINKAQISGFAKLQIDLPAGLTATAIETKGASFTFADGKAKFIWMALPAQPSFKVSYTLSADANASGILAVNGRLSYIEDNERKVVDMPPSTIIVGNGQATASSTPQAKPAAPAEAPVAAPAETPAATPALAANPAPGLPQGNAPAFTETTPPQTGPGNVSAARTVESVTATEYLVTVTVRKGALRGFGKLQENLPEGFTAVAKQDDDAIFSTQGNLVKFVWLNLPSKEELKVSYRMLAPSHAAGQYTMSGEFGYLVNDLTQKAKVGSTAFAMGTSATASAPTPPTPTTAPAAAVPSVQAPPPPVTQPVRPSVTAAATPSTAPPAQPAPSISASTAKPKATAVPAPESGIAFKVQITAAHREVGKAYFEQRHHYSGDFSIEHHQGWIKYVAGLFDQYTAARNQRQAFIDAQYNFPGPFVTAYNNGERITVQEALMISKQRPVQ